jgi:hypothetical protein
VSCVRGRGRGIDRYIVLTSFTVWMLLATSKVASMLTFVYLTRVSDRGGESMLIEASLSAAAAVAATVAAVDS